MAKILIVEDEKNLGLTLNDYLSAKGYQCTLAQTAQSAQKSFEQDRPVVVLMDIGLPDGNGLDLAKKMRSQRKDFILLFLSALNDPSTRLEGLELGAEDYITKPFELKELTLRLQRVLKTHQGIVSHPDCLTYGDLKIWFNRYEVEDAQGQVIALSQKECAILELLHEKKNTVVSRDEILENIWGDNKYPSNRTVDNYIVKLRKWTDSSSEEKVKINSIRGVGYKLEIKDES